VNITITGGTGFIGHRLVARLLAGNHSLHLLVRHARIGLGAKVQCSVWNALDIEPAVESLADADAVIHLAGEPVSQRWTPAAKRGILESRVEGTRRLIEALSRQSRRPSVLVCASAVGFYGSRGDAILTESAAAGEGFLPDVCTVWEKTADAALNLGMRVVKLRSGMTLGKEGGALAQMLTPFRWGVGGKVASGEQWISWIHVEDLVELIQFAVENPGLHGPVNATAPNPVTNTEFTRELAAALHRPAFLSIPAAALRGFYGEMAEIILSSQRAVPQAALSAGFRFRYPELGAALRNLLA
jgi:uncharacterized protein (TIGR01777 family)